MSDYEIVIHADEEGGFWAEVPELPGCYSQGETREEVEANIREAMEAWLWDAADDEMRQG
jgi:predicted RNase H-like HicB family nuclease